MTSRRTLRIATGIAALAAASTLTLSACSGDSDEAQSIPDGADPAMIALCDQMVSEGMSAEDADALAVQNGYVSRVGSVDGEPRPVTLDYRTDRFTLTVEDDAVTGCEYG